MDQGNVEDRVPAVDERGQAALDEQLDDGMDGRVIGMVAVQQGVKLHAPEARARLIEQSARLRGRVSLPGVGPHEAVDAGRLRDDGPDERVVGMEDDARGDAFGLHLPDQAVRSMRR